MHPSPQVAAIVGGHHSTSFREYTVAPATPLLCIPSNVSDAEASTVLLAAVTAGLGGLWHSSFP